MNCISAKLTIAAISICLACYNEITPTNIVLKQDEINELINQINSSDVEVRSLATKTTIDLWQSNEVMARLMNAKNKLEETKDINAIKRLEYVLNRVEIRRILGYKLVELLGENLDVVCDDESQLTDNYEKWTSNPKHYGIDDEKRLILILDWISGNVKTDECKVRLARSFADYPALNISKKYLIEFLRNSST
ncbi:MAG: hypothetical protein HY606_14190, partial [Planctomycetes bacterium]|nr:hypothetical protein [Planctomycetota bacterium]